jgi:hypothetical protein
VSRIFALALISLAIAPARAAEIAIRGRVVDETNAPVAGVRVRFSPKGTPEAISSDAAGGFEVKLPLTGRYLVEAGHAHFFPLHAAAECILPAARKTRCSTPWMGSPITGEWVGTCPTDW